MIKNYNSGRGRVAASMTVPRPFHSETWPLHSTNEWIEVDDALLSFMPNKTDAIPLHSFRSFAMKTCKMSEIKGKRAVNMPMNAIWWPLLCLFYNGLGEVL
jgi:hypothetical protein